jgi:predicted nucleic acid-binding protein
VSSAFLDSNVLIYAFANDARARRAREVLQDGPVVSVQSLNEFANVARRKLGRDWRWVRESLGAISVLCPLIVPITVETHGDALRLAERYGYSIFDSLVVASALGAGCDTLWSEDMQHGMVIDSRLRIANPFRTES